LKLCKPKRSDLGRQQLDGFHCSDDGKPQSKERGMILWLKARTPVTLVMG